jgi:hypothetical protein
MKAKRQFLAIDRVHIVVGRDDSAEICAEGDSDGWAIIDGTNTHLESPVSRSLRLLGEAIDEIGVNVTLAQDSGALGGNTE